MRALWLTLLPILILAQSPAPPRKSVPVDNAATATNGAKDSGPQKGASVPSPAITTAPAKGTNTNEKTAKSSPSKAPPEIPPDPIVTYTLLLVVVGTLQFVALIVQAGFLCLAFNETTKATGLTAQALAEAQRSNAANEALTRESNAAAKDATELTRQSFIFAHRPKLIVRTLYMQPEQTTGGMTPIPPPLSRGSRVDGQFYIVNIGDTTATVTEVFADVLLAWDLPTKRPYEGETGDPMAQILRPGQSFPYQFFKEIPLTDEDVTRLQLGAQPTPHGAAQFLHVVGFVAYTDELKTPRRTAFARKYNMRSAHFEKSDNYDYEHAE
jgi:hypothetical protein